MKARYIQSANEFLNTAGDELLLDEIRNNLAYGIAERVASDFHAYGPDDPWFIIIEDSDEICATVIRTPPHRPILAHLSGDSLALCPELVAAIHSIDPKIPGITGDREIVDPFAQHWCSAYERQIVSVMAQRIYKLDKLIDPKFVSGSFRQADMNDEDIVYSWSVSFQKEAMGEMVPDNYRQSCTEHIKNGNIYLWDNAGPKSMAAKSRPTLNGISINNVYTPPEYRNSGYATSCVAALCGECLTKYSFCVLYTDLSNPVSNSIYKRIGFIEHSDSAQYTFSQ